jgi:formiminotetrahydrofolate cyclodeaminase
VSDSLSQTAIGNYLDALASSAPAPGGGSAVALGAALAAALAEMVCRLSIGRSEQEHEDAVLRESLNKATVLRNRLLDLSAADADAYAAYVAATALPKSTPEERSARDAARQAALRTAADVPLAIAEACVGELELLESIARLGNIHVLSDAEVAALLADAGTRGALANVRVNARLMKDRALAQDYVARCSEIEAIARTTADAVITLVRQRI